ncbi:hypothetical protein DFQ27_002365 [Actinomortierella ambigua]|uniref:Uncharacterized protein n=1 Tax=Actinomortierella ambigua TaxID=1343610 RepID=A0A9P6QAH8_9FUNG|nr:hypothetical protein DFQ27_002365 [Actinomortierella ambigua]
MPSIVRIGLLVQALLLFVAIVSAVITPEIKTSGLEFQQLREVKGHWDGAEYNPDVDAYNGKKHQLMKTLGEHFGKFGTLSGDITAVMGRPDEIKKKLDHLPVQGRFFVYKWRGNHDYLWFKIGSPKNMVVESDWVTMADIPPEIQQAGQEYQKLRQIKGHFDGGSWDDDVDSPQGKKRQVMDTLGSYFGQNDTLINNVVQTMGEADVNCDSVGGFVTSDYEGCSVGGAGAYLVYKWRGFHDYLWFKRSAETPSKVVESDWFYAWE